MSASASSRDNSHPYAEGSQSRSRTPSGHSTPHDPPASDDEANLLDDDPLGPDLREQYGCPFLPLAHRLLTDAGCRSSAATRA